MSDNMSYNNMSYNMSNFEEHVDGNMYKFGLNSWGCDSIIKYNNEIWKFIGFIPHKNDALYINKNSIIITITGNEEGIVRMQKK